MSVSGKKVVSNIAWKFTEKLSTNVAGFVVSLVLARLLEPRVYGMLALVTIITSILQIFVDSGLGVSLIQKKNADDVDFSTVFYFNIGFSLLIYLGVYAVAPQIAKFYNFEELTPVIRVLALTLVLSPLKNIQQSYISKTLQFRMFFYASLPSTILAGTIGIIMAYKGFGIWALVTNSILNIVFSSAILWVVTKWRPVLRFSFAKLKQLFSFGWKILASQLLNSVYTNLTGFIIGKKYSPEALAYYSRGSVFPTIIATNVDASIDSVLFPAMAEEQDKVERVKQMTRRAIRTSTYIMAPLLMGLAACSEPMVRLLLTDKWLPCVPYVVIFSVACMFYPIHTANLNAIKALGRSDLFLYLEIAKKVVGLVVLLLSMQYGPLAMALCSLISNVLSQIINSWPNKKLLNYSYLQQLKDLIPYIALSMFMGGCVWTVTLLHFSDIITLLIQIPIGTIIYVGTSKLFGFESFNYLINILQIKKLK